MKNRIKHMDQLDRESALAVWKAICRYLPTIAAETIALGDKLRDAEIIIVPDSMRAAAELTRDGFDVTPANIRRVVFRRGGFGA